MTEPLLTNELRQNEAARYAQSTLEPISGANSKWVLSYSALEKMLIDAYIAGQESRQS